MSANPSHVAGAVSTYTAPELIALMTLSILIALVLAGFIIRLSKTMRSVKQYEEACIKVQEIEQKLDEMARAHARECFELEQIIFDRNNEVIELKNKLLSYNKNGPL